MEQQNNGSLENLEADLHPIACLACRRGHRKCDRYLPICKECKSKGKECVYPSPMKKGPQPKTSPTNDEQQSPSSTTSSQDKPAHISSTNASSHRHHPYGSSQGSTPSSSSKSNAISQQQYQQAFNFQMIDLYFDIVSIGCPILQRQSLLEICSKKPQENSKFEELSMLYAIQALCYQRLGKKQDGRESFQKARKYLSDVFDMLNNFEIAASFLYLALYCAGEGENNQTKYYLGSVQFFISQNKETLATNEMFMNLCKMFMYVGMLANEELPITFGGEGNQNGPSSIKEQLQISEKSMMLIYQFFMFFTQELSDGYCGKTVSASTSENTIKDVLTISSKTAVQYNRFEMDNSPARTTVTKLLHLMIVDGLRLGVLSKSPENTDEAIIETANRITGYTTLLYFPYLPSHVVTVVSNAAIVHLAVLKQIQRGERVDNGVDFYELIRKDHRALLLLSDRYSLVEKRAKPLIDQLYSEISRREQKLAQLYPNISNNIIPTYYPTNHLPNIIPTDSETMGKLEELLSNNPEIETAPQMNTFFQQEQEDDSISEGSTFLDVIDFMPNTENFYTDPQQLVWE